MSKPLRLVLALAVSLPLAGCPLLIVGGAALGTGAIVWSAGWLKEEIPEPIYRVHRASAQALLDHKWQVEINELDEKKGLVDGYTDKGKRVVIETKKLGDKKTRIRIRVGVTGNKALSRQLLEQIKKHL